jgi:hypothetical protein
LSQVVVQLSSQATPLFILNMYKLCGQTLQFEVPQLQLAARRCQLRHPGSKFLVQILSPLFQSPSFTQVTCDLGEAAQFLVVSDAQSSNDDRRPELSPIFSDAPAFIREAPHLTPEDKHIYRVYYDKQLESLRASINQVSDLAPLSKLKKLDRLDLGRTQVKDIAPLAELTPLPEEEAAAGSQFDLPPFPEEPLFNTEDHRAQNGVEDFSQAAAPEPAEAFASESQSPLSLPENYLAHARRAAQAAAEPEMDRGQRGKFRIPFPGEAELALAGDHAPKGSRRGSHPLAFAALGWGVAFSRRFDEKLLRWELEHFVECVGTRAEPRTSGADAVRTQALMDRLLQAMGLPLEDQPHG